MEENKNQTGSGMQSSFAANGIIVKDLDGKFKIASDGELKELDSLLASTAVAGSAEEPTTGAEARHDLSFPKFTDLVLVPKDEHFKEPVKMPAPGSAAELHFHPEDQHELERELEKINTIFSLAPQKKYSVMKIAQKLAEKHAVRLSENELRILTKALLSFFRQTRNSVQTRSVLVDPKTAGGLGIANDTADHVIAIAKHLKHKIEETDGIVVDEESSDSEQPTAQVAPKPQSETPKPVYTMPSISAVQGSPSAAKAPVKPVPPSEPPVTVTPAAAPKVEVPAQTQPKPESPQTTPVKKAQFFVDEPEAIRPAKPEAHEPVKPETPKVVRPTAPLKPSPLGEVRRPESRGQKGILTGRIEELATMDLDTWRMLDPDPRIRAGKILGKIQYLEQESLTRKSQGIEAWRNNEVYRYYLELGQQSLEQKKNVRDIIADMEARAVRTLTLDEFEAISDLNRMLRF